MTRLVAVLATALLLALPAPSAFAGHRPPPSASAVAGGNGITVGSTQHVGGGVDSGHSSTASYSSVDNGIATFVWNGLPNECATFNAGYCTPADPAAAAALPQVTGGQVAAAFRRIPLPAPRSQTQPARKTLVNFDTIFYVDTQTLHRTITLLGQRIDLRITPSRYTWHWGDGTTATTADPGAPYPAKDVLHRYPHTATVAHHVTITWTARFRIGGGAWRNVPGTATTNGPDTDLRVVEAVPVLSGNY